MVLRPSLVLVLLVAAMAWPTSANACSACVLDDWADIPVEPLPTNGIIRIAPANGGVEAQDFRVQDAAGNVVPGQWVEDVGSWWSFAPENPYAPDTDFEVVHHVGTEWKAWKTFHTGPGRDDLAPDKPVIGGLSCRRDTCASGGCCGPYDGVLGTLTLTGSAGAARVLGTAHVSSWPHPIRFQAVHYLRFRDRVFAFENQCGPWGAPGFGNANDRIRIDFDAVDTAGNTTPADESLLVVVGGPTGCCFSKVPRNTPDEGLQYPACLPWAATPDAGSGGSSDGGVPADSDAAAGCGCAEAGGTSGGLLVLAAGLHLAGRLRSGGRRRNASRGC